MALIWASPLVPAMYNPAFFSDRQESTMPAKKQAGKKRKTTGATRKKTTSKKTAASRKKSKVSRKKTTARKSAKKKTATRKKTASGKKTARKTTKKKASKKVSGKAAKKKASKKKASAKKASKKKAKSASKKKSSKKTSTRKPSKKKAARKASSKKAAKAPPRKTGDVLAGPIHGIEPYQPARNEDYMNPEQLEHFREILLAWKRELMNEVDRTLHHMQDEAANFPDPNDRATQESEFGLELRTRDRERKLLRKINSALARIDDGTYGYCEETGEEIGLKRLEARPVATLCLEAQERREKAERQFRDRDDRYR